MFHRRGLLTSALGGVALAAFGQKERMALARDLVERGEVPWLEEIQTPLAKLPADAPMLTPLCREDDGTLITRKEDWLRRRPELLARWKEILGPMPGERKEVPELEVIEEDRPEGVIRQLVRYEVEPGIMTEAYICKPAKAPERVPGVVAFHSTVNESIRQPAGVEGLPEKAFGVKFARQGRVVICPRNCLWPDNTHIAAGEEAERFLKRHPKTKGMGKMLYDGLVAVDILASLPEVDQARLGTVGHSLGAKEVLYLAAFDERLKVSVSSEGGIGTKFSNWEAPWYLGETIREKDFKLEHHELLGLIAPRPFLLIGGESADGDRGWPFIAEALSVYELFGRPCRIGQYNHRGGHAVPPEAEKRIEEWFATYL